MGTGYSAHYTTTDADGEKPKHFHRHNKHRNWDSETTDSEITLISDEENENYDENFNGEDDIHTPDIHRKIRGHQLETQTIKGNLYRTRTEAVKETQSGKSQNTEGMTEYSRYSREPPEREYSAASLRQASGTGTGTGIMRDCCRTCCTTKTCDNNNRRTRSKHTCDQYTTCNERRTSDSYVACRNNSNLQQQSNQQQSYQQQSYQQQSNQQKNPTPSKSAPLNVHKYQDYNHHQNQNRHGQPNKQSYTQQIIGSDNNNNNHHPIIAPRVYPPPSNNRRSHERAHIPLPPPPPTKSTTSDIAAIDSNHNSKKAFLVEDEMYTDNNYKYKNRQQHNRSYPYEEPGAGGSTYEVEDSCTHCNGYDHCPMHRICKCQCMCSSSENCLQQNQSDERLSYCSDSSNSGCMNLAYQRTGDYPELMDELENTLSYRNRMRVQKTMQRFEMLSRQNKNLEKPIFEDDESINNNNNNNCCNNHYSSSSQQQEKQRKECKCPRCENNRYNSAQMEKQRNGNCHQAGKSAGYVEKVARHMDPNLNEKKGSMSKEERRRQQHQQQQQEEDLGNGSWQMDARKGEWVKVTNRQTNQYDFENSYPPLPPRPVSCPMYDRQEYNERPICSCSKCTRRNNR